jgi:hypothetical protein
MRGEWAPQITGGHAYSTAPGAPASLCRWHGPAAAL